jgi:hypothetical protein
MLDAWLDFAAIKYQAIRQQEGEGELGISA